MLNLPKKFYLEPTNYCNLRCTMCPTSTSPRKKGFMDFDFFCRCIDSIPDQCSVNLYHSGEPLLHHRIVDMVSYISENKPNITSTIATNATILTEDLSEDLIKAGLGVIIFSFDAVDKKIYEEIRIGSNYDKTWSNINKFVEKRIGTIPSIIVDLIKIKKYKQDMNVYMDELFKIGVDTVRIKKYLSWIDLKPEEICVTIPPDTTCTFPFTTMLILWDGTVIPCCPDINVQYDCGNVFNTPLIDVWNGDKLNALRQVVIDKQLYNFYPCKNCQDIKTFEQPYEGVFQSKYC